MTRQEAMWVKEERERSAKAVNILLEILACAYRISYWAEAQAPESGSYYVARVERATAGLKFYGSRFDRLDAAVLDALGRVAQ